MKRVPLGEVTFAELSPPSQERIRLGWKTTSPIVSMTRPFASASEREFFLKKIDSADVLLIGERATDLISRRLQAGKLTIYMSERWWKPPLGRYRLVSPKFILMCLRMRALSRSERFHYLPIGHYAAKDVGAMLACNNRTRLWGYFPQCASSVIPRTTGVWRILWVGRLLRWKRVERLVEAAAILWARGHRLQLTIVGDGPERHKIEQFSRTAPWLQMLAPRPHESIQALMQSSHIYVLPSSAQEGWGAVVNEAMAAGCLVFASKETGAGRTIIYDGENGFHINPETGEALANALEAAFINWDQSACIRANAAKTIRDLWSADVAAERFVEYCSSILSHRPLPSWSAGPLSIIK